MQRAGDKNFDKFELYALNNVFNVPPELAHAPVAAADESGIDAELEGLWTQLRQELATKSELQQRVATASREVQRWEAHRTGVESLCTESRSEAVGRLLRDGRQLDGELRRGREQLQAGAGGQEAPCLQHALSERRIQISTVRHAPRAASPPPRRARGTAQWGTERSRCSLPPLVLRRAACKTCRCCRRCCAREGEGASERRGERRLDPAAAAAPMYVLGMCARPRDRKACALLRLCDTPPPRHACGSYCVVLKGHAGSSVCRAVEHARHVNFM